MSRHFICYSVLRPKWLTSGPRTRSRRRSNWSRRPKVSKRLPLSGSRRIFWRDGRENAVGCLLDELQAFQKQLRVSSVKADVVPRGGSCFKTNRRTNHVCHRLRLGLTDTFRCLLEPLVKCISEWATSCTNVANVSAAVCSGSKVILPFSAIARAGAISPE